MPGSSLFRSLFLKFSIILMSLNGNASIVGSGPYTYVGEWKTVAIDGRPVAHGQAGAAPLPATLRSDERAGGPMPAAAEGLLRGVSGLAEDFVDGRRLPVPLPPRTAHSQFHGPGKMIDGNVIFNTDQSLKLHYLYRPKAAPAAAYLKEKLQHFSFRLDKGQIFYKPTKLKSRSALWKPFPMPFGVDFVEKIYGDDATLHIVDRRGQIHHMKLDNFLLKSFEPATGHWEAGKRIKAFPRWRSNWYQLPGARLVVNCVSNQKLYLPPHRAVAMSRKGTLNGGYYDPAGKFHLDITVGVDTIYLLSEDGKRLFFADPWLTNRFEHEITMPFHGSQSWEMMTASGSVVVLMNRRYDPRTGRYIIQTARRFADFDSMGHNPFFLTTGNRNNPFPHVRYLPPEQWVVEETVLPAGDYFSEEIQMRQTGMGNHERELSVWGERKGVTGIFKKKLADKEWTFTPILRAPLHHTQSNVTVNATPLVHNYQLADLSGRLRKKFWDRGLIQSIELKNYMPRRDTKTSEGGLDTYLEIITRTGSVLRFPIYSRGGLKNIIQSGSTYVRHEMNRPLDYDRYPRRSVEKKVVDLIFPTVLGQPVRHKIDLDIAELPGGRMRLRDDLAHRIRPKLDLSFVK